MNKVCHTLKYLQHKYPNTPGFLLGQMFEAQQQACGAYTADWVKDRDPEKLLFEPDWQRNAFASHANQAAKLGHLMRTVVDGRYLYTLPHNMSRRDVIEHNRKQAQLLNPKGIKVITSWAQRTYVIKPVWAMVK